jgi:hypothetical protein
VDALEHQHALGDPRAHHLGDREVRLVRHDPPDQLRVAGLLEEVELGAQVCRELVDERIELEQAGPVRSTLGQPCRRAEEAEVQLDLLEHSGPANLDRDLPPVRQQGGMDLRDRRRRQRLLADLREHARAQVAVDDRSQDGERHRLDVVDETAQLLDVGVGQQVGPRGEDLAELDEGRPELLERLPELAGALGRRLARRCPADLAEDPDDVATARSLRQLEDAPEAPTTDAHAGRRCPQ